MGKGRKPVPITRRSKKSEKGVKRKRESAGGDGSRKVAHNWWGCASVVDKQAANVVGKVLGAAERKSRGVNIKSLTLADGMRAKKATHAVVCQTLKFLPVLRQIVEAVGLLEDNPKLRPALAYVLAYEILIGQGCRPEGPAERAVLQAKDALQDKLQQHLSAAGVESIQDLVPDAHAGKDRHRYARVNLLKASVKSVAKKLKKDFTFEVDEMLPDVLKFPPGTTLHNHALVENGSLMLQGYGSCMCARALAPGNDWHVLDACAAPGNKTTHLASVMGGKGAILALDKDANRLQRLAGNVKLAGAKNVEFKQMDFLSLDPEDDEFGPVDGILLDPSCSGSGTAASRMDHLLPVTGDGDGDRISRLADFQASALEHAMRFPQVRRIVYSTCSIHAMENEEVVKRVLPFAQEKGFKLTDPFPAWHRRGLPLLKESKKLVRTDPDEDAMDGFFLAMFERKIEQTKPPAAKAADAETKPKRKKKTKKKM
ncbi:hypothetical protein BSKO_00334 [Bryopsis sp. KO-2023]|nr:hypothetical protein BSKO_00334 [Bryopsis sp. KO-2023]